MHTTSIKAIRSLGIRQTYNLTMKSPQHNYLLRPGPGQPVHKNSHSLSYIVIAYWSAWLKTHYPQEWWATVMNDCDSDRMGTYMGAARVDGVRFNTINIENLTAEFTVDPTTRAVTPGLTSIKGIGDKDAANLTSTGTYADIDEFVARHGKDKTVMQRLIHLGAFKKLHPNLKATWAWYQYKYCTGVTELKTEIRAKLTADWTESKIKAERQRQVDEHKRLYPRRLKIPNKILNWKPIPPDDRQSIMNLYQVDYNLKERLGFEKEYLGYYVSSPLGAYQHQPDATIANAKRGGRYVDAIIEKMANSKTKADKRMCRVTITDGKETGTIILWEDILTVCDYLDENHGYHFAVNYDSKWNSFSIRRGTYPTPLESIESQ